MPSQAVVVGVSRANGCWVVVSSPTYRYCYVLGVERLMVRSAFRDCTCVDLSSRYSKQKHTCPNGLPIWVQKEILES
jgi:hypothetical protein